MSHHDGSSRSAADLTHSKVGAATGGSAGVRFQLTLYVTGAESSRSVTAKRRLDVLVRHLDVAVDVEVVDVLDDPDVAGRAGVFATPTLVRELPAPSRRVIGDLSDTDVVTAALGDHRLALMPHQSTHEASQQEIVSFARSLARGATCALLE